MPPENAQLTAMPTLPENTSAGASPKVLETEIRPVRTRREYEACVELQRETWGRDFSDVVPVGMLEISVRMGGICVGAFGADGSLLGFVFGVTGPRQGELAHWSHMLAVGHEARNAGIGKRLKFAQRDALSAQGVGAMYWTFDPLVARNAHFNLNHLGVAIAEYVPDMYGTSDSDLHRLGTDRFIVRWGRDGPVQGATRETRRGGLRQVLGVPGEPGALPIGAEVVEVLVPRDIEAVEAACFDEAVEWRASTRRAFLGLLGEGYSVVGFNPGREYGRYVLARAAGGVGGPGDRPAGGDRPGIR